MVEILVIKGIMVCVGVDEFGIDLVGFNEIDMFMFFVLKLEWLKFDM